jgi:SAM-dependent methyltransferase
MLRLFARRGWHDRSGLRLLEVGSGGGANLLELLGLGFAPDRLAGVELLAARHAAARALLPPSVTLHDGDATALHLAPSSQDIVLVSTVFSSLLDDGFQQRLAERIWHWTRPGGGVLWYDFTIDNPRNPDVRGVPLRRVRKLFPEASIEAERVTLAPPIARVVSRWHPSLYTLLNSLPMLRTHVLAWLAKT